MPELSISDDGVSQRYKERLAAFAALPIDSAESAAKADYELITADILELLSFSDSTALSASSMRKLLARITYFFGLRYHSGALRVAQALQPVVRHRLRQPTTTMDEASQFYDALYHLYWCASSTLRQQRGFSSGAIEPFVGFLRSRTGNNDRRFDKPKPPYRFIYLSQFTTGDPGNAHQSVCRSALFSIAEHQPARFQPTLYAWQYHDDATAAHFEAAGIPVRRFPEMTPAQRVEAIAQALNEDRADIVLTDSNTAVPAALFARRVAPIQIYYQLGMPFFPTNNVDHIFRMWDVQPETVGFDPEICQLMPCPWSEAEYNPPRDPAMVLAERTRLRIAPRLFGTFGRLAKITPEFVEIAARLLERHTDLAIAIGGTGDAGLIREVARQARIPSERFIVHDAYVDGHIWAHCLDVFLDTFPQQGGLSCREVIAKGVPVVSMSSPEMPNVSDERVPLLRAQSAQQYLEIASRLATDDNFRTQARSETRAFFQRMPSAAQYATAFAAGIEASIARRFRDY